MGSTWVNAGSTAILLIFIILLFSIARSSIMGSISPDKYVYFEIVMLLLLAVIGELAVSYFRIPSVMILMVLGVLMSTSFISVSWNALRSFDLLSSLPLNPPELIRSDQVLQVFAQLGAIILLFKVGLKSRIGKIFALDNFLVAACGVILPFIAGYLYASFSGGDFAYSMFLGAALTATSVGISAALLKEHNLLEKRFAQVIIGAAILDDILGLLVLAFVTNISSSSLAAGGAVPLETIGYLLLSSIIFIMGGVLAGEYFVRYLDRKDMSPRRFLIAISFMLLYAYLAEFVHLSAIVGAFLAGMVLNRSRHSVRMDQDTEPLEYLLVPIFFISIGMMVDVNSLAYFALPILAISAIAMLTKVIGCGFASLMAKEKPIEALIIGIGMSPRGEVALIVASIGLSSGILSGAQFSIISAMALITTFATPPMLNTLLKHADSSLQSGTTG